MSSRVAFATIAVFAAVLWAASAGAQTSSPSGRPSASRYGADGSFSGSSPSDPRSAGRGSSRPGKAVERASSDGAAVLPPETPAVPEAAAPAGAQPPVQPVPVQPAPPAAVPVMDPAAAAMPAAPPDPCAPFAASTVSYEACVDRMKKIQRMRDAAGQREEDLKAYYQRLEQKTAPKEPAAAAPATPPAAAPTAETPPSPPPGQ